MRRINYKSDIPPLLLSLKVDEKQITVPECDFIVRFYVEGYEGRHYDCSHIGGVWSNCEPSEDGTKLVCYINNQRLGIGELCAEFHYISPDRRYSDGSKKSVVIIDSTELGVELVEDNGDAVTEAAIDVTLPFIYRTAYEIARDHGYNGTAEDFYSALASVVAIADAEKKRVTAEITRNANEQERIENEENRLNAESERVNAEAQRVRNEAIRGDAESVRVEQEEDRKAKFVEITGFIATVRANEGNRESNELERQTNEDTRITEEAKRVEAEKKRAAEFEQQKLDLTGKIDRSGDEMGGDLIFTDNAGVSFRTSDGGAHTMFNGTDDVAKFTADNGDTFEFKQNETPNKNSSAVVVSANLYNALDMTLDSMGSALDGDAAYRAEDGDKIFNPDTCKIQRYNSTIGGFEDLCDPIDGKLYANKMTDYIYRWNTEAKKMVFVGGVKAYTKDEADRRFAKLDDATQIVKAKDLEANNSVTAKSMWIGDEGLLLGGDGNGHLTVEQDEVITDVTLNVKLATKADDVAYGVEWYNGQPTGEMQETTVKDATQNTTYATLLLAQSYNILEQEVEKKANKTELATINANVDKKVSKTDIVQNTGQSTTSVMSQKAVSDRLIEVDGKMSEISKEQLDDNTESIDFTSDEGEYVAHVDSEGVHAKDFFIQDAKIGKIVSVNASLENKFDEENTPIVKESSSIHEEKIEITTDDGIPVAGANKSGLYATNYFQLVDGRKIPFALSLEAQRQLAFEPNYTSVKYGRLNGGTDNHGTKWYKRFSILHISDTHQYNKEYAEAVSIASGKVDIICNTGDDGNGNVSQSETVSIRDLNKGVDVVKNNNSDNLPYLYVKGNHDVCNLKRSSYRNIIGSLIDNYSSNVVWGGADVGYGYIDMTPNSDIGTVRIIMLDQFDYPDADFPNVRGFMSCTYSQAQIAWFINVIKDATSKGIKVMTMAHYAFANTTNLWSEEIANADVNGQYQDAFIIPDIIDAVQHGTSINMTYNDSKNKENIIVNEDFSTTARLHYICHLFGHIHSKNWYQCKKADGSKEYDMLMIGETSVGRLGTALNKSYREGINSTACSILEIDTIEQCVYRVNYGAYMEYDATESKVIEKLKYRFL